MTTKAELIFDSTVAIFTVIMATSVAVFCEQSIYSIVAMGALGGIFYMSVKNVVKSIITSKPKPATSTCKWPESPRYPGYYNFPHIKQQLVNARFITVSPFCSKCGKKIELVK